MKSIPLTPSVRQSVIDNIDYAIHPDARCILDNGNLSHSKKRDLLAQRKWDKSDKRDKNRLLHVKQMTTPKQRIMYVNNRAWSKSEMHKAYPEIALAATERAANKNRVR